MSTKKLAKELGLIRKRTLSSISHTHTPSASDQLFSYLMIIDFESTCWREKNNHGQEIIEFPAVLMNTHTGQIESEFHSYVQPQEHPLLSSFCTELTGITQKQVEGGLPLQICLSRFTRWVYTLQQERSIVFPRDNMHTCTTAPGKPCAFLTWSDWDLGVCLQYECKRKQITKPDTLNSWIDLRATYRIFYHRKPKGLNGALQDLGIKFSGREHSGLDDARNTARLAWRMINDGCVMKITKSLSRASLKFGVSLRGVCADRRVCNESKEKQPTNTINTHAGLCPVKSSHTSLVSLHTVLSSISPLHTLTATHTSHPHTSATHTSHPHTSATHTSHPHTSATHTSHPHTSATHTSHPHTSATHTSHPHTSATHTSHPHTSASHTSATHTSHTSATHTSHPHTSAPHTSAPHASAPHASAPHTSAPHTCAPHMSATHTSHPHTSASHTSATHTSHTSAIHTSHTSATHTSHPHTSATHTSHPDMSASDLSEEFVVTEFGESGSYDDMVLEDVFESIHHDSASSTYERKPRPFDLNPPCLIKDLVRSLKKHNARTTPTIPFSIYNDQAHHSSSSVFQIPSSVLSSTCNQSARRSVSVNQSALSCLSVDSSSRSSFSINQTRPSCSGYQSALSSSKQLPLPPPRGRAKVASCINSKSALTPISLNQSALFLVSSNQSAFSTSSSKWLHLPPQKGGVKITAPLCDCGRRSRRLTVCNGGPNNGRAFYTCTVRRSSGPALHGSSNSDLTPQGNGCGFFKWVSALI